MWVIQNRYNCINVWIKLSFWNRRTSKVLYGNVFVTSLHAVQTTKLTASGILLTCYVANNHTPAVPRTNHSYPFESVMPKKKKKEGLGRSGGHFSSAWSTVYFQLNAVLTQADSGFQPPCILRRSCMWVVEKAAVFWLLLCFSALLKIAKIVYLCPVAFLEELLINPMWSLHYHQGFCYRPCEGPLLSRWVASLHRFGAHGWFTLQKH